MHSRFASLIIVSSFLTVSNCDTKKDYFDDAALNIICYSFAGCGKKQPTRVGMIGDSWTDLLLGFPAIDTLRIQLENKHGYQITGATLGGQTLKAAFSQGLHYQVIDQAGADVNTILLSLGGNDLQANLSEYANNFEATKSTRLREIKNDLKVMIQSGNAFKLSKYGGAPLKWIIHGYDYSNPYKSAVIPGADEGCRTKFISAGVSSENVETYSVSILNSYNEMLRGITSEEPTFYYTDLRRSLGGPPIAKSELMLDCIHPNNLGFEIIGNNFSKLISPITGVNP